MAEKPSTRWGYDAEETQLVVASTLSVAVALGDLLDEVCIVGGLVPTLLIDYGRETSAEGGHCGTNDLDVGLAFAVLDDERYKVIAERLHGAGFRHDETDEGRAVIQRWTMENVNVTVDFLIAPMEDEPRGGAIKHLESDFGANSEQPGHGGRGTRLHPQGLRDDRSRGPQIGGALSGLGR